MLRLKFVTGFVVIPIVLGFLYFGGWPLFVFSAAFMLAGLHEFYSALLPRGIRPVHWAGWLAGIGILGATQWAYDEWRSGIITLLFSYFLRLRLLPLAGVPGIPIGGFRDRMGAVVLVLAAVWTLDTVANIIGGYFGTKRPWSKVSPNKTWEGCLSGLLGAMVATLVGGAICRLPILHMLALGAIIGVVAQLGDFCESLIKRDLGLKDFGTALPGHGGVLDRFDSIFFTAPVLNLFFVIVTRVFR
jgi:phosphatidate cytidylyltransferase